MYQGYISLNRLLKIDTKHSLVDFVFFEDKMRGAIAVMCDDHVYLLSQRLDTWTILHK